MQFAKEFWPVPLVDRPALRFCDALPRGPFREFTDRGLPPPLPVDYQAAPVLPRPFRLGLYLRFPAARVYPL